MASQQCLSLMSGENDRQKSYDKPVANRLSVGMHPRNPPFKSFNAKI
jgi:hypothetical protein